jgi:methenyltetrahydromethanopterin cyclohydrolase
MEINKLALEKVKTLISHPQNYKIKVEKSGGTTLIDCGVTTLGSISAGKLFAETTMGGLGQVSVSVSKFKDINFPIVHVQTDHPTIACLAAQKAGWKIKSGNFFAMGSGPARALAKKPKGLYKKIDFTINEEIGIICLEVAEKPPEDVQEIIAMECQIARDNLYILYAPTSSIASSVQIAARCVETCILRLHNLGFDTRKIISAIGTAPIAPVFKGMKAMGATNDCIIYGSTIVLYVDSFEPDLEFTSDNAPNYGESFETIFKSVKGDFYKIDPSIFAPAKVLVNDICKNQWYTYGKLNYKILSDIFGGRN